MKVERKEAAEEEEEREEPLRWVSSPPKEVVQKRSQQTGIRISRGHTPPVVFGSGARNAHLVARSPKRGAGSLGSLTRADLSFPSSFLICDGREGRKGAKKEE